MTPAALRALGRGDATLRDLIRRVGPIGLVPARRQPYRALVEAVTHQQLNGRAAATILGRVKGLFPGKPFPRPEDILATRDADFRGAGLSRAKTLAVKDIAAKTVDGLVPSLAVAARLSDEEIVARLTAIRGVGRWTVEMFLIFTLGREDVLPADDFGVRKGFQLAYRKREMPSPRELRELGERWRPHRTTVAWYLWRAVEIHAATRAG